MGKRFDLTAALVCILAAACFSAAASDRGHHWQVVAADSSYQIAIDTTRIEPHGNTYFVVWYRTDHTQARMHKGKAFNRELVKSLLRCGNLSFKIESVDMSMGGDLPIAQQKASPSELQSQPWRPVERGTIEETVARAACDIGKRQAIARVMR